MFRILTLTLTFCLVMTRSAHAYIDPATGAMVVQLIVAGCATAMVTVKLWWHRVKRFFKKGNPAEDEKGD